MFESQKIEENFFSSSSGFTLERDPQVFLVCWCLCDLLILSFLSLQIIEKINEAFFLG